MDVSNFTPFNQQVAPEYKDEPPAQPHTSIDHDLIPGPRSNLSSQPRAGTETLFASAIPHQILNVAPGSTLSIPTQNIGCEVDSREAERSVSKQETQSTYPEPLLDDGVDPLEAMQEWDLPKVASWLALPGSDSACEEPAPGQLDEDNFLSPKLSLSLLKGGSLASKSVMHDQPVVLTGRCLAGGSIWLQEPNSISNATHCDKQSVICTTNSQSHATVDKLWALQSTQAAAACGASNTTPQTEHGAADSSAQTAPYTLPLPGSSLTSTGLDCCLSNKSLGDIQKSNLSPPLSTTPVKLETQSAPVSSATLGNARMDPATAADTALVVYSASSSIPSNRTVGLPIPSISHTESAPVEAAAAAPSATVPAMVVLSRSLLLPSTSQEVASCSLSARNVPPLALLSSLAPPSSPRPTEPLSKTPRTAAAVAAAITATKSNPAATKAATPAVAAIESISAAPAAGVEFCHSGGGRSHKRQQQAVVRPAVAIAHNMEVQFPIELSRDLPFHPGMMVKLMVEIDGRQQGEFPSQEVLIRSRSQGGGIRLTVPADMRSLVQGLFHRGWRVFENWTLLLVLSSSDGSRMTLAECKERPVSDVQRQQLSSGVTTLPHSPSLLNQPSTSVQPPSLLSSQHQHELEHTPAGNQLGKRSSLAAGSSKRKVENPTLAVQPSGRSGNFNANSTATQTLSSSAPVSKRSRTEPSVSNGVGLDFLSKSVLRDTLRRNHSGEEKEANTGFLVKTDSVCNDGRDKGAGKLAGNHSNSVLSDALSMLYGTTAHKRPRSAQPAAEHSSGQMASVLHLHEGQEPGDVKLKAPASLLVPAKVPVKITATTAAVAAARAAAARAAAATAAGAETWEQESGIYTVLTGLNLGLTPSPVRVFSAPNGGKLLCLDDLILASGHPKGNLAHVKSYFGSKLYRGPGLPLSGLVLCAMNNGRHFRLDVAPLHIAVQALRLFVASPRMMAHQEGMLGVAAELEEMGISEAGPAIKRESTLQTSASHYNRARGAKSLCSSYSRSLHAAAERCSITIHSTDSEAESDNELDRAQPESVQQCTAEAAPQKRRVTQTPQKSQAAAGIEAAEPAAAAARAAGRGTREVVAVISALDACSRNPSTTQRFKPPDDSALTSGKRASKSQPEPPPAPQTVPSKQHQQSQQQQGQQQQQQLHPHQKHAKQQDQRHQKHIQTQQQSVQKSVLLEPPTQQVSTLQQESHQQPQQLHLQQQEADQLQHGSQLRVCQPLPDLSTSTDISTRLEIVSEIMILVIDWLQPSREVEGAIIAALNSRDAEMLSHFVSMYKWLKRACTANNTQQAKDTIGGIFKVVL